MVQGSSLKGFPFLLSLPRTKQMMPSLTILCAFVTKIRARWLFDDLAVRHRDESWKQTKREQTQDGKRAKRERDESMERLSKPRHRNYEDNSERKISGTGKCHHPGELTIHIKQARVIQALFHTYSTHESHLNRMHLSAFWTSFGRLARQSIERHWLYDNLEAVEPLVKHTVQAARKGDI